MMNILGIVGQSRSGKDTVADHLVSNHHYVKIALADPIKRLGREVFGFTDKQLWGPSEYRNELDKRYDYYCRVRLGGTFNAKTHLSKVEHECDLGWLAAAEALQKHAQEWLDTVLPEADVQSLFDWFAAMGNDHPRISPRVMLQHLGTEWGRYVADEDIWVNVMLRAASEILRGQQYDRRVGLTGFDPRQASSIGVVVSDVRFLNEMEAIRNAGGKLIRVVRPATDKNATKTGIVGHASEAEQKAFQDDDFDVVLRNQQTVEVLLQMVDVVVTNWRDDQDATNS
jgi:hypothetical protein